METKRSCSHLVLLGIVVAYHHVILPPSTELKEVFHVHAAVTTLLVRTPLSLVDVLVSFQHTEAFLLSICHASLVCIALIVDAASGRMGLLVQSLPWLLNQSILLPVVMLENALILPQRLAILSQRAQEESFGVS